VLFVDACPHIPLVLLSAINCVLFIIMHVALMVIAFPAFRNQNMAIIGAVALLHMFASLITLFNTGAGGCSISLPLLFVLVIGLASGTSWLGIKGKL